MKRSYGPPPCPRPPPPVTCRRLLPWPTASRHGPTAAAAVYNFRLFIEAGGRCDPMLDGRWLSPPAGLVRIDGRTEVYNGLEDLVARAKISPQPVVPLELLLLQEDTEIDCTIADEFLQASRHLSKKHTDDASFLGMVGEFVDGLNECYDADSGKFVDASRHVKKLVCQAADDLMRAPALFQGRVSLMRQAFLEAGRDVGLKGTDLIDSVKADGESSAYDKLITSCATSAALCADTVRLGERFLREMTGDGEDEEGVGRLYASWDVKRIEKVVGKEVKKPSRLVLDVGRGTLEQHDGPDSVKRFTHAEISQLIKSRSDKVGLCCAPCPPPHRVR